MTLETFLHWSTLRAPPPFSLCQDLHALLYHTYHSSLCQRCGRVTNTRKRVAMCFVRDERMCFTCYHRSKWPPR
jgi:hypothetical protein